MRKSPQNNKPIRSNARGKGPTATNSPGATQKSTIGKRFPKDGDKHSSAETVFHKTSMQHEKNAKAVLKSFDDHYVSSSEEEDLDDNQIISKLTKSYKTPNFVSGDVGANANFDDANLGSTAQYLIESCQSGAMTCLVCISRIKRQNETWSCFKCYGIFHLKCIKQWVMEGVAQATLLSDEHFPNREQPWYCPKCRQEYSRDDCPQSYFCFCGKIKDPPFDPWIVPHSCGQLCNKLLQNPTCGHQCLLLCHPGPCPPCPQTIEVACHCAKKSPVPRRCGSGAWSCGKICDQLLSCKRHKCKEICHEGECRPCQQTSVQSCKCTAQKTIRPCASPEWSCGAPCGRPLLCGFHSCEKICHEAGECGDCPKTGVRACPCGKKSFEGLSCKDEVEVCGDTCGKTLGCYGNHKCTRLCHFGECGPCPIVTRKPCRCKRNRKEGPCHKEFTCEWKCTRTRSCGNHQCKRKCCKGNCPPCEQVCNQVLRCKKHKCQMPCHKGPCYPCTLTFKVTCNCGKTAITVVCGKEKKAKPPKCRLLCSNPSGCHHESRSAHVCHFGNCPDCKQVCDKSLGCGHPCPIPCHDNVKVKNEIKPTAPWEKPQQLYDIKALPCPPCKVQVPVVCRGGHETRQSACCDAKGYSCGKECGRNLRCSNHKCTRTCHVVKKSKNNMMAGETCEVCDRRCEKPKPPGCNHKCVSACHRGDCAPCTRPIRMRCYCGTLQLDYLCSEWLDRPNAERESLMSCGNDCPKMMRPCGHPCPLSCHAGTCPTSEDCKKKIFVKCPCKRMKKDFLCSVIVANEAIVDCDSKCLNVKARRESELAAEEQRKQNEEEKQHLEEIEKFERKMGKRPRPKKEKAPVERNEPAKWWRRASSPQVLMLLLLALASFCLLSYLTTIAVV